MKGYEMAAKQLKEWVICDPYAASASALLESFDTRDEAEIYLSEQLAADEDGWVECHVLPRDEAMANYS